MRASPSASAETTVTDSSWFVVGAPWSIVTLVTVGAEFWIAMGADVAGAEPALPSFATTSTEMSSPLLPCPGWPRSSVAPVAPGMSEPSSRHW